MQDDIKSQIEARAQKLLASKKTLQLATSTVGGTPTASYAPFVRKGKDFYVYTSELSRHTADLRMTGDASILVIENEASAENLFARRRITFSCFVLEIPRQTPEWNEAIGQFENTFGEAFARIRPLPDFVLFCLEPLEAFYVEGFGRAYRMSRELTDPVHVRGTGHGAKPPPE
ncbi:hypothetical protein A2673_00785 [Candidatus Kaiserbacteria bacterium RIFCSPHIGHO2_01_FULL_50_13]|uniref:Pyridoxamine 5'-phosphate oxidase N-terminal domain-containing protein n=1 Tax=Candidatus Kaiserbacteria bacterium RIFCSPLOWO2_01_FULL_50_24 TaxID=1798507 RepID=A0A1F6EMW1_9BACT|nr:MAG: hypothetical protein A2673_00785 [Candidatus Kaiserbacteria bacterium RIFCSPHIGHO2_01_FULL_50_13]OGG74984.1 MAG: hypothetical protein A3A34_04180 [Candidatus Kaiserbacteria bacterium RIFCSPLOWO2_01_FULL_50_24]OGG81787.1 MAG: hypothetical protein A3H74_01255 [Candidatus Kaiserbacteria bacterium RIFCSPLOWO2_02_FULL_51_13]